MRQPYEIRRHGKRSLSNSMSYELRLGVMYRDHVILIALRNSVLCLRGFCCHVLISQLRKNAQNIILKTI